MSKRIASVVAVLATAGLLSGCGKQPSAGCIVQDSTWIAKYNLTNGATGSCAQQPGDLLGVYKFVNPNASEAERNAGTAARLAIRPSAAAALTVATFRQPGATANTTVLRRDPSGAVIAPQSATSLSATFDNASDAEGFCAAGGFPTQVIDAAEVKNSAGETAVPATRVEYTFKNIQVFASPSAPGTQMRGNLTFKDNACTAEYEVWALWPPVSCTPGSTVPADSCGEGSGLNPDFDVVCDEVLEECVPARRPPSFKAGVEL